MRQQQVCERNANNSAAECQLRAHERTNNSTDVKHLRARERTGRTNAPATAPMLTNYGRANAPGARMHQQQHPACEFSGLHRARCGRVSCAADTNQIKT